MESRSGPVTFATVLAVELVDRVRDARFLGCAFDPERDLRSRTARW